MIESISTWLTPKLFPSDIFLSGGYELLITYFHSQANLSQTDFFGGFLEEKKRPGGGLLGMGFEATTRWI